MADWDARFLELARLVSTWSKDPSTQVGAVITRGKFVVSLGFNGHPKGVTDSPGRLENREVKYRTIIHAEINAILTAKQDLKAAPSTCGLSCRVRNAGPPLSKPAFSAS